MLDENPHHQSCNVSPRHVGEARQVQLMRDGDRLGRTVTVFGENEIRLSATRVVALERVRPVQQNDHVSILFQRLLWAEMPFATKLCVPLTVPS